MAKIYLLVGDVQKGPFSEEEIEEMYVNGTITDETLHWMEGLSDWQVIGLRDDQTGKPRTVTATIAPSPRSKRAGWHHSNEPSDEPVDLKEKNLKLEIPPAEDDPNRPSIGITLGLIVFFFVCLTFLVKIVGHAIPDAGKKFEASVTKQMSK